MQGLRSKKFGLILAIVVVVPIGIVAINVIVQGVLNLLNPCFSWGSISSATVTSFGKCASMASSSETVTQLLLSMILVPGGILAGGFIGIFGILRSRPAVMVAASVILIVEAFPLFFDGLFVFNLIAAVFFLWGSQQDRDSLVKL